MEYLVELVLRSYLPLELEEGMLFINRISVGVIEPYIELWELDYIPDDMDEFITKHGAPVEIHIVDEDELIATMDEIGWMDDGEHTDELRDITLKDINTILREYDGYVNIEVDEDGDVVLYDDRIVLSLNEEFLT
jgi:hypothetical protein